MFFNKKKNKVKIQIRCYDKDKIQKYDEINDKNIFINVFYFVIIKPEDMVNKVWTECTLKVDKYEVGDIYEGLYDTKTGEITIYE